jgi:hypothetical protein
METEHVTELKELFDRDYRDIILDLRDLRLAHRDAVRFLRRCEADGMKLENCPAYVREWIESEKDSECNEPARLSGASLTEATFGLGEMSTQPGVFSPEEVGHAIRGKYGANFERARSICVM